MSYQSIDAIQNLLAKEVFSYTSDCKKASGRALGTFVEIITFYLLKTWGLEKYTAIERPLQEFANNEITHNVEFTMHCSRLLSECEIQGCDVPITVGKIKKRCEELLTMQDCKYKTATLVSASNVKKNACTIATSGSEFVNAYLTKDAIQCYQLRNTPFAMFECKRVGVEEGMKKGPQTIEKAKQGSYVARTVSQNLKCM